MTDASDARYWIDTLGLVRHPEGGYYRETYRSSEELDGACLPERYLRNRSVATAIYYLLPSGERSKLHRLKSDELWHYHAGLPLVLSIIAPSGELNVVRLGASTAAGEQFQCAVQAGCWFGAEVDGIGGYGLVSCTVAPGFDYADFEIASREDLIALYPQHRTIIERLTDP
jgi:uncharacterized protein